MFPMVRRKRSLFFERGVSHGQLRIFPMICNICGSSRGKTFQFDFPFYRHLDFSKIADSGTIFQCDKCFGVCYSGSNEIKDIYSSDEYVENKKTFHVAYEKPGECTTVYSLQAEYLSKEAAPNSLILDIGCFDGKLLSELRCRLNHATLYGFDVSAKNRQYITDDIHFRHTDLSSINLQFDLIILVNVISYIEDIQGLMANLKRLLKRTGRIYIETTNIDEDPCQILYGDLYNSYNCNLMTNLLGLYGFGFEPFQIHWAARSLSGMAQLTNNGGTLLEDDGVVSTCLTKLNELKEGVCKIRRKFKVLGTTLNASLVYNLTPETVECFIEENPSKQGGMFNDLQILHPKTLVRDDLLVLPYGRASQKIKKRFEKYYPCEVLCF